MVGSSPTICYQDPIICLFPGGTEFPFFIFFVSVAEVLRYLNPAPHSRSKFSTSLFRENISDRHLGANTLGASLWEWGFSWQACNSWPSHGPPPISPPTDLPGAYCFSALLCRRLLSLQSFLMPGWVTAFLTYLMPAFSIFQNASKLLLHWQQTCLFS